MRQKNIRVSKGGAKFCSDSKLGQQKKMFKVMGVGNF
jgi:hypothetical protein